MKRTDFTIDNLATVPMNVQSGPSRALVLASASNITLIVYPDYEVTIRRKDGNAFQPGEVPAYCGATEGASTATAMWE